MIGGLRTASILHGSMRRHLPWRQYGFQSARNRSPKVVGSPQRRHGSRGPGTQTEVDRGDCGSRGTPASQDASLVRRVRDRAGESRASCSARSATPSAISAAGARRSSGASRRSSPCSSTRSTPSSPTMFPEKSGGIALYAHEGWRKYTTLVGPIATFGYWIGWSVVLAVIGLFIGQIVQGAWFPGEPFGSSVGADDGYFSTGGRPTSGCPRSIAIGLILAVWLFNVFGARVGVTFGYAAGILLMVPLFVMMFLPFINGSFDSANLTNKLGDRRARLGRAAARARLALADVLVGLGSRRLCDVRPRVQGHRARHEARAPVGGAVLDGRLHPPADRASSAARGREARRRVRLRRRDGPDRRHDAARRTSSSSVSSRASSSR